jgi:hypothetical protein
MGGKALKQIKTIRFTLDEYNRVSSEIKEKLKDFEIDIPHSRPNKDSFGDLDVLIKHRDGVDIRKIIIEIFNPIEIVSNCVYSFSYPSGQEDNTFYQIDIITVKSIEAAMFYFSFGDVGAIIGRYAGFYGLTFSDLGLGIKVRNGLIGIEVEPYYSHKTINLTSDPREICSILGMIYDEWLSIKTDEDVYKWLVSSRYYDLEAFGFIPMDKRKRIDTRPIYSGFMKFIGIDEFHNIEKKVRSKINWTFQRNLLAYYDKDYEFETLKNRVIKGIERRDKFNAEFFMKHNISGPDLGKIIAKFKKTVPNWEIFLDLHTREEVEASVDNFILKNELN